MEERGRRRSNRLEAKFARKAAENERDDDSKDMAAAAGGGTPTRRLGVKIKLETERVKISPRLERKVGFIFNP